MPDPTTIPSAHFADLKAVVNTSAGLGELVRSQRVRLSLRQLDVAGGGNGGISAPTPPAARPR